MMKVIIIGAGLSGINYVAADILAMGHSVTVIEDSSTVGDYHIKDVVLETASDLLAAVRSLSEYVAREEEMTHAYFYLIRKPVGGKVPGLYGKVSPRRGMRYRWQES